MSLEHHFHPVGVQLVLVLASTNQRSTEVFLSPFHTIREAQS